MPLGILVAWSVVLGTVLVAVERRGGRSRTTRPPNVRSRDRYDRLAGCFGEQLAPLMSKTPRYYARSPHVRYNVVVVVLLIVQATLGTQFRNHAAVVANMTLVGLSAGALSLNMFGLDGPGFRRCLFLPATADIVLLANSLGGVLLNLLLVPVVLGIVVLVRHQLTEPRMLALLAASGVMGTFLFQGIGVWTSILAPRAIPFYAPWGHRWSMGATAAFVGGVLFAMWITWVLSKRPEGWAVAHWWLALIASGVAGLLYVLSLQNAAKVLGRRRETLLFEIEALR